MKKVKELRKEKNEINTCLDLVAERAGFKTVGQCKFDEYASKILAKTLKEYRIYMIYEQLRMEFLENSESDGKRTYRIIRRIFCVTLLACRKGLGDSDSRDLWGNL